MISLIQMPPKMGNETVPQPDCEGQVIQVAAEVHAPPINSIQNEKEIVLEFPFQNENGDQQTLTLPVCISDEGIMPVENSDIDLENMSLVETDISDLPSELWTSDLESLFLPKGATETPSVRRKSSATSSRILTSNEVIQAKKEKEEQKEKKAKRSY